MQLISVYLKLKVLALNIAVIQRKLNMVGKKKSMYFPN